MVNNAGTGSTPKPIEETSDQEWQKVLGVNLTGAFYCTKLVAPSMKDREEGRIINISSLAGQRGSAKSSPYAASKRGLIAFTMSLARELGP